MLPDRRYLKLRFVGKPETDEQIASFMRYDDRGSIYEPQPAFLDSDNPNIRAMVEPLLELRALTEADRERFDALGARETGLERMLRALDIRAEDLPASSDWQHHVANTLDHEVPGHDVAGAWATGRGGVRSQPTEATDSHADRGPSGHRDRSGPGHREATARLFAAEGASVAAVDVNAATGAAVADDIRRGGGSARFFQADVSDSGDVRQSRPWT